MKWHLGLIIISSPFFVSCNYTKIKGPVVNRNAQFNLPSEKVSELSYGLIAQKIFIPKCVSCHGNSGRVNLESYSEVTKHLEKIKEAVFEEKTMPKKGALSQEELSFLWNWIKIGAPENAQNGNPPPVLEPILPTFDSINSKVFQTTCKDCHNPIDSGKRVPLDKESLLNSPLELVLPGNPEESGLIIAIERIDDKRMPPAKEGYSELSAAAKEAITIWIQNGAAD